MPSSLSRAHLNAWRRYYVGFWRVINAVEADLSAHGLPSLSWYDALFELYLAPGRQLQLCELARHAMLSRSGLSRLIDKLEREGLIRREASSSDGRAAHATLTPKGIEMLRRIWTVYSSGIARQFAAHLTDTDANHLSRILAPIAATEGNISRKRRNASTETAAGQRPRAK